MVPVTLALWNGEDTVDAGVLQSGALDAAVAAGTAAPTTQTTAELGTLSGMLPGESRGATFTVRNTGNTNLVLGAAIGVGTNVNLLFDVSTGACPATPPQGTALSATSTIVSDIIPPATNASFCLRITLSLDTPASAQNTSLGSYAIDLTAESRP